MLIFSRTMADDTRLPDVKTTEAPREGNNNPNSGKWPPTPGDALPERTTLLLASSGERGATEEDEPDALPPSLHYGNFDFFCTVISIVTYLADLIMDLIVCVYFYHLAVSSRHYWYFGLTLAFILLPSLTMTGFSFRWYLMDADNADLERVPLWKWILRLVVLMLQVTKC